MAKKTFSELADILDTKSPDAITAIEQGGTYFKSTVRQNPPHQIIITTEAQIEAKWPGHIIPDGESEKWTIILDETFTATQPLFLGENNQIEIKGSFFGGDVNYTGPGAWLQLNDPTKPIESLRLGEFTFVGDATNATTPDGENSLLDLKGTEFLFAKDVTIKNCKRMGIADFPIYRLRGFSPNNCDQGMILKNILLMQADGNIITQVNDLNHTLFSFIAHPFFPAHIDIKEHATIIGINPSASFLFIDPNFAAGSKIIVKDNAKGAINVYQSGTDIAATASAVGTDPNDTQFDITAHDLKEGQVIVLKDFTIFTGYNGTFIVTAINDVNSVDIAVAFLGVDSSGTMSAKSLDQKDVKVDARGNIDDPDSMTQAELRQGSAIIFTPPSTSPEPVQNSSPTSGDFIADLATEDFTINISTGVITYIGTKTVVKTMGFKYDIFKSGGGAQTSDLFLYQNATAISKFDRSKTITTTSQSINVAGIITINPGDTFQLHIGQDSGTYEINYQNIEVFIAN